MEDEALKNRCYLWFFAGCCAAHVKTDATMNLHPGQLFDEFWKDRQPHGLPPGDPLSVCERIKSLGESLHFSRPDHDPRDIRRHDRGAAPSSQNADCSAEALLDPALRRVLDAYAEGQEAVQGDTKEDGE